MAKISLILDTRRANAIGQYPVQLRLSHNSKSTSIGTGVSVRIEHWNGEINQAVIPQCPNARRLNNDLEAIYFKYSNALRQLEITDNIRYMSVTEIKRRITAEPKVVEIELFTDYFERYADSRQAENSRSLCHQTRKAILAFCGPMEFSEVTVVWLKAFDAHLIERGNSINTRAFHFRNIRAVLNSAINEDLIGLDNYPFRKFKIASSRKDKEALTKEQLQRFMNYQSDSPFHQIAKDMFMLSFFLCGMNLVDLYHLERLRDGRAHFIRSKTSSKTNNPISLLVQPEASKIISRYKGEEHVLRFIEEPGTYATFNNRIQKAIRAIAKDSGIEGLTFYWARYTWATLADRLGVSEKEISKGLGHVDTSVAGKFYISYDWTKVDRANRKVINYIAIKKKTPAK